VSLLLHRHPFSVQVGFTIGLVAVAAFLCAYIDGNAVSAFTGCSNCDRSEYIATCLFDVFAAIALLAAGVSMALFGRATPLRLADQDLQTQELLHDTAKQHPELHLPLDTVAVVAVHAPCCGQLIAVAELPAHRGECEERARLVAEARAAEKEARRAQRQMARGLSVLQDEQDAAANA
jgi:hypothetical protein